jgi:hypothetical protein
MLEPGIAALHDGAAEHLGVFVEPSLVLLRTSRIDHDVGPLFGAEAELHLALEHPNDLRLIGFRR